jgi:predicted glycoside hydrolase/deacetylase ChbG (UPF0249 family)
VKGLIVNADDLGLAPEVDRGVLRAALAGRVTSATLMVTMPGAEGGAHTARRLAALGVSVGLHVDLVTGRRVDPRDADAVLAEVRDQAARFETLVGRPPTHLDSHKHTHRDFEPVRVAVAEVAHRLGAPVRAQDAAVRAWLRARGLRTPDGFVGDVSAEPYWTVDRLLAAVGGLDPGTTELMCHPGEPMGPMPGLFYLAQRATELTALLDPRLPAACAAAGVRLATFTDLG